MDGGFVRKIMDSSTKVEPLFMTAANPMNDSGIVWVE